MSINTYQWDDLSYSGFDCEVNCAVWDNYIFDYNGEEKLVCNNNSHIYSEGDKIELVKKDLAEILMLLPYW